VLHSVLIGLCASVSVSTWWYRHLDVPQPDEIP
jgi:hypothetical protein